LTTQKRSDPGVWLMRDAKSPLSLHIDGFLAAKRLASKSRKDYGRYLRQFDEFTGGTSLEEALTLDNASAWIEKVTERGVFAAHNAAMYLKSFASWAKKSNYLTLPGGVPVLAGLEAPSIPKGSRNAVSDDQLDSIWAALADRPNRDRHRAMAYMWLLLATGLRRNEARQLAIADLHLDVGGDKSWVHVRWQTSKGSKERRVRMDRAAVGPIEAYVQDHRPTYYGPKNKPEPLFITEAGKPFTENGFGSWAGRIFDDIEKWTRADPEEKDSGLKVSSHWLRHTWATQFNRASRFTGLTAKDLMVEGGWANIQIADRYMHERPWEEMLEVPSAITLLKQHRMAKAS
jgi:integrase